MRCPRCGKDLEPDTKLCPYCNKQILESSRARQYSGVRHQQGRVATDGDYYEDVLKPRSQVSLKGVGARMSGSSRVRATRHKISDSEFDSSLKIRCLKCGTVNEKGDRNCRNCGSRITS